MPRRSRTEDIQQADIRDEGPQIASFAQCLSLSFILRRRVIEMQVASVAANPTTTPQATPPSRNLSMANAVRTPTIKPMMAAAITEPGLQGSMRWPFIIATTSSCAERRERQSY